MRTIAILNPNATERMTQDMLAIAGSVAPPNVAVIGATNATGPAAIQGEKDAIACLPGLFDMAHGAVQGGADAIIIACFDDTGLDALRASLPCPVIGLGEAGMLTACLVAPRFAVVTTTQGSVPVIEDNIARMGLMPRCGGVYASGIPVLSVAHSIEPLSQSLGAAAASSGATAIVLGCAAMSAISTRLAVPAPVKLIDPLRAAIGLALTVGMSV
ncbi:aspartate/glutamate racemase family protein [Roseicyclus sp.]|uniref:aspartate/glutamate racemase family protein n=1 Tax=Roseicyclus sp. TaxID=1914329 RepID=UPI003F6A8AAE